MPDRPVAGEDPGGGRFGDQFQFRCGDDLPLLPLVEIIGQHRDSMTGDATHVGIDQDVGRRLGHLARGPHGLAKHGLADTPGFVDGEPDRGVQFVGAGCHGAALVSR